MVVLEVDGKAAVSLAPPEKAMVTFRQRIGGELVNVLNESAMTWSF